MGECKRKVYIRIVIWECYNNGIIKYLRVFVDWMW